MAERTPPPEPQDADIARVIHRASDLVARARGPAPGQVPPPPREVPILRDQVSLGPNWLLATETQRQRVGPARSEFDERQRHALAERITKAVRAQIENELPILVRAALDRVLDQDSAQQDPSRPRR